MSLLASDCTQADVAAEFTAPVFLEEVLMISSATRSGVRIPVIPCLVGFLFLGLVLAPHPAAAQTPGWTQIDVTWPGNQLNAPYTGNEGTASFDIYVKDKTGKFVKKPIELKIKKGRSAVQHACDLAMMLDACIKMGYQFTYEKTDNGITIQPTDAGADPDKEGMPKKYPPDEAGKPKVDMKVVKETHPVKK